MDELEPFLLAVVPDLAREWCGVPPEEIDRLEALVGRPLPRFYRWFLRRMGYSMGGLAYGTIDFSITQALARYEEEDVPLDPRYLRIGLQSDPVVPMHYWYDLDRPARDDAFVIGREDEDGPIEPNFETFREKLAYGALLLYRIHRLPHLCEGTLNGSDDALAAIGPALESHGFRQPVSTGPYCGVFDRNDAAVLYSVMPDTRAKDQRFFEIAGGNAGIVRRIVGVIATETAVEVEIDAWHPPLR